MGRRDVVVLGGGMAGLTAAWELSKGAWRERFDSITVYQRGWRLGGKGASSRGANGRIEEHGLHILLGYYDATFRLLREVYDELDRPVSDPACPIQRLEDAVTPAIDIGLAERDGDRWTSFVTRFSRNDLVPGRPGAEDRPLRPLDVALRSVGLLVDFHRSFSPESSRVVRLSASPRRRPATRDALVRAAGLTLLAGVLEALETLADGIRDPRSGSPSVTALAGALDGWRRSLRQAVLAEPAARRTWQLVDLVVTNLRGMAVDGLLADRDYDRIDHLDYREWLGRHGAAAETISGPIVRGMYDLTFAYESGDRYRPRFAAGLGLDLAGRMLFDFKGSIFWRMEAGMGEIVFAPLYQALAARGVRFRFFHRLDRLRLSADGDRVDAVELTRQARLLGGDDGYRPLTRFGGLPCWPAGPDHSQLVGEVGDDLESHRRGTASGSRIVLRSGDDFGRVVLAVSLGMIPHVASELVERSPRWRAMVEHVGTVATRSLQLWLNASEDRLGWRGPSGVTLSGFGDTFDTWASMSHLLDREGWDPDQAPQSLAYFCGAVGELDDTPSIDAASRFLDDEVRWLWPAAVDGKGFRWDLLWDQEGRDGRSRLEGQYLRTNADPSDRYVQSLPGSGRHRLAPDRSGFSNLVLAGDWTDCGLNAGCVEAATRSGVLAARAVSHMYGDRAVPVNA